MNYTASVTLTGVDNLSKMLSVCTSAMQAFVQAAGGAQAVTKQLQDLSNAGKSLGELRSNLAAVRDSLNSMSGPRQNVEALTKSLNTLSEANTRVMSTSRAAAQAVANWTPAYAQGTRSSGGSSAPIVSGFIPNYLNQGTGRSSGVASPLPGWSPKQEEIKDVHAFTDAITGGMRALSLFYVRARNIAELMLTGMGLRKAASETLEFYSAMETSRLSLAASELTFRKFTDAQGNALTGSKAYAAALKDADEAQTVLRAKVFDTTATFAQLTVAYQKVVAASGNSTATTQDFADLTVAMSNMATAWNVDLNTISTQFQSTLLGVSRVSSRVGGFLRAKGVDQETLKSWRDQGIIVQELNKLLVEFKNIGEDLSHTWAGVSSNFEDAVQNMFGEGFRSSVEATKSVIESFTAQLVDVTKTRSTGQLQLMPGVKEDIENISEGIAKLLYQFRSIVPVVVSFATGTAQAFVDAGRYLAAFASTFTGLIGLIDKGLGKYFGSQVGLDTTFSGIFKDAIPHVVGLAAAVGGLIGAFLLLTKAVDQLTAAQLRMDAASVAMTTGPGLGPSALASLNAYGSKIAGVAAGLVSFAAKATLVIGAASLAGQAIAMLGEAIINYVDRQAEASRQTQISETITKATIATYARHGIVMDDNKKITELLSMSHEKQVNILEALDKMQVKGTLSLDQWTEAKRRANAAAMISLAGPASVKEIEQFNKEERELAAMKDKTGRTAILNQYLEKELEVRRRIEKIKDDAKKGLNPEDIGPNGEPLQRAGSLDYTQLSSYKLAQEELKKIQEQQSVALSDWAQEARQTYEDISKRIKDVGSKVIELGENDGWTDVLAKSKDVANELQDIYDTAARDPKMSTFLKQLGKDLKDAQKQLGDSTDDAWVVGFVRNNERAVSGAKKAQENYVAAMKSLNAQRRADGTEAFEIEHKHTLQAIEDAKDEATEAAIWAGKFEDVAKIQIFADKLIEQANKDKNDKIADYEAKNLKRAKRDADDLYAIATTAASGIAAAYARMHSTLRTEGQITADMLTEQWQAVGKTIDGVIFDVATGKFDDLKSVFTNLAGAFVDSWSKAITKVVQNWLAGVDKMGNIKNGTPEIQPDGTVKTVATGLGPQVNRYVNAAAGGYATGSAIGSTSGAPGWSTGSMIGGTAGAIFAETALSGGATGNPWVALAAAVVGGIIGILSAPNTENHAWVGNGGNVWSRGTAGGVYGDKTVFRDLMQQGANSMIGGLSDAFKASGSAGSWKEFVTGVNKVISNYINNMSFEVHAGSDEDMKKNFEYLLKGIIPKEMLFSLFGVGKLLNPGTAADVAGISGSTAFDTRAGMDTNAPLYKLFASLGFTADRIKQIADEIATTDPAVFLERVKSLLGVVGGLNALVRDFSGGPIGEANRRTNASPADAFQKQADNIKLMFDELSLFSGDEQLTRAKAATEAARQYWEAQIQAIQKIQQLINEISTSIGEQLNHMADVRVGKDANWLNQDRYARLREILGGPHQPGFLDDPQHSLPGLIGDATNPDQIAALAREAQSLIQAIFDDLNARLQQGKALMKDFGDVIAKFEAGSTKPLEGVVGYGQRAAELQQKIAHAATLSGQAQLDALEDVKTSAVALYEEQAAMLATIHQNLTDLNSSIASQIEDINSQYSTSAQGRAIEDQIASYNRITYAGGHLTESQQRDFDNLTAQHDNIMRDEAATRAMNNIPDLQSQLATAQSPEEVRRITQEIQDNVNRYIGSFREDDPRRRAAAEWATGVLRQTQDQATAAYHAMEQQINDINETIRTGLLAAKDILTGNMTAVATEMLALEGYLRRLNDAVGVQLNAQIDQLVAKNGDLIRAIQGSVNLFTQLNTTLGASTDNPTAGGNPTSGGGGHDNPTAGGGTVETLGNLTTSGNNARVSIDNVAASGKALADVFDRLILLAGGTPPTRSSQSVSTTSITNEVVSFIKANPHVIQARTRS